MKKKKKKKKKKDEKKHKDEGSIDLASLLTGCRNVQNLKQTK